MVVSRRQQTGTRRFRRTIAVTLGAVLGLLLLEAAMQVVAWIWWSGLQEERRTQVIRPDADTILCIGDSFTYGLGASERARAYPTVLAAELESAAAGRFQVVNRGRPGAGSGYAVRTLAPLVRTYRPRLVYLLIGYNDTWSTRVEDVTVEDVTVEDVTVEDVTIEDVTSAAATAAEPPQAFEWKLRTVALFGRIATALFDSAEDVDAGSTHGPGELLGTWHSGQLEITFDADGQMRFGPLLSQWRVVDQELRVGTIASDERVMTWRRDGDELVLRGESLVGGVLELRSGPVDDPARLARAALREERLDEAEPLIARLDDEITALALSIELHGLRGRGDAVERDLAALRERSRADPAARAELARVLLLLDRIDEGLALAAECLGREPRHIWLWQALSELPARRPSALGAVLDLCTGALQQPDLDTETAGRLWVVRSTLRERYAGDYVGALTDALRAGLARGAFEHAATALRLRRDRFDQRVVTAALAELDLPPEQQHAIDGFLDDVRTADRTAGARLERHLVRCAELCRAHGVELVLLTYPEPMPLCGAIRRAASSPAARLLDLTPVFAAALRTRARSDLFVPDGHCNDAGYELMARTVFADTMSRTR